MFRPFQLALDFSIVLYGTKISNFRKFNIGLIQSKEYPSVGNSVTKVTIQNIETNSNDSINQNVIKVTAVIILNYRYSINSIE